MLRVRAAGFTLTELVIIMVVVGLLAGVAVPRFLDTENIDVPAHAERLRSLLRYGQRVAIAQNRPVYVDISSNRVSLCFDDACNTKVLGPLGANSGTTSTSAECAASDWACEGKPSGLSQSAGVAEFTFDARGKPFADADDVTGLVSTFAQVTLTVSGGSHAASVIVEPETGYVH